MIFLQEKDIIVNSFKFCQEYKDLRIHAWVVMSNHIHCILSTDKGNLSEVIRDFKSHTSKQILKSIENDVESRKLWILHQFKYFASRHKRNKKYQLWTHENHPIELHNQMFDQRIDYIHQNPVRAGLVWKEEEYVYSSAIDYHRGKGLLIIDVIEYN